MGSVCSMLLCGKGLSVTMWGYDAEQLGETAEKRENTRFLPGHKLDEQLVFEPGDDKAMLGAVLLTFVLQLLITYVPFAQDLFGIQALPLPYLIVSLLLSTVIFWAVEVEKWFKRRKQS